MQITPNQTQSSLQYAGLKSMYIIVFRNSYK